MATRGQMAYRKYLQSDHWRELRSSAVARDGKCVLCGSGELLQVHHRCYPKNWYDGTLEHVETLCRDCHRTEHGYGPPSDFEITCKEIQVCIERFMERAPVALWKKLQSETLTGKFEDPYELECFASLMFWHVMAVVSVKADGLTHDNHVRDRWRTVAIRVRNRILSRSK